MRKNFQDNNVPEFLQDKGKWENRELGADPDHTVKSSQADEDEMDDAMGLQVISVRLPKALITQLKHLASHKGLGYQPYLRMVLMEHVRSLAPKGKTG